jgi:hypothetical protein
LVLVAFDLLRRRRTRSVGFFAAFTIWTAAIWVPFATPTTLLLLAGPTALDHEIATPLALTSLGVVGVVGLASLVTALFARVAHLPRAA